MYHSPIPKRIRLPNKKPNNSTHAMIITHCVSKIKGTSNHQTHSDVAIYFLIIIPYFLF